MCSATEAVVPSVLSVLTFCHEDVAVQCEVRTAGSGLLEQLLDTPQAFGKAASLHSLVVVLHKHREAICIDTKLE